MCGEPPPPPPDESAAGSMEGKRLRPATPLSRLLVSERWNVPDPRRGGALADDKRSSSPPRRSELVNSLSRLANMEVSWQLVRLKSK